MSLLTFLSLQSRLDEMTQDSLNAYYSNTLKNLFINQSIMEIILELHEFSEYWIKELTVSTSDVNKNDNNTFDLFSPASGDDLLYVTRVWIDNTRTLAYQAHRDPRASESGDPGEPQEYWIEGCREVNTAGHADDLGAISTSTQIGFYPIPNATYVVKVEYFPVPVALTENAAIPRIPAIYQDMILVGAAKKCALINGLVEQVGCYQNEWDNRLAMLRSTMTFRHRNPHPRGSKS